MPRRIPLRSAGRTMLLALLLSSCGEATGGGDAAPAAVKPPPAGSAVATFAGGCFWCMEPPFEKLDGVVSVVSGYSGGPEKNPTYEIVSSGRTGHAESVQIVYDPAKIGYERLLQVFWHNIDPTSADGQFCDRGRQYRSAIFAHDSTQRRLAVASKEAIERANPKLRGRIVTQIVPFTAFYPAEEYHQDFHHKDPVHYQAYRLGCGRDRRLQELWGKETAQGSH